MKYLLLILVFPLIVFSQSYHTVSFSGNSSDFNTAEKYVAADNVDYYVTFDATYMYVAAFRTSGSFGDYDHFTVYVDSDPNATPTSGTGSTSGVTWDSNTPSLPFTANYRIAIRKVNLGESFYSSYSGSWSTGGTNGQSWTQYTTATALEVRIPWSELGSPSNVYLRLNMSYNGGFFGGTSANYFGSFAVTTGVTPLTISDSPLPVELTGFSLMSKQNYISLAWQTATETNNHGFEIEKKQSGAEWRTIGFKQGNGTTNNISNYSYTDNSVTRGKVEYRLKQIDRDGKFSYSNTVEAFVGLSPNTVELTGNYPNPFNPSTSISFMLGTTGNASLKVYDLLGKEVAVIAQGIFNAGEMNTFNFNAAGLTSGVYYYRLTSDAKVETRKMMLMK